MIVNHARSADTVKRPDTFPLSRRHWLVPVCLLGLASATAWLTELDLALSGLFFSPEAIRPWPVGQEPLWRFLYRWGELPAIVLFMVGIGLMASGTSPWRRSGRPEGSRAGTFLVVALIVGPLLITNGILKGYYGRPRPKQIEAFGGDRPFQPVWVPTFRTDENSFPSGHGAAGFAMLLPYFIWRERRPRMAGATLAAGLLWGGLVGSARIVQGGHFFSDVVWSAGVVYLSGYAVARLMEAQGPVAVKNQSHRHPARYAIWGAALAAILLIAGGYLARLPIESRREWVVPIDKGPLVARIVFVTEKGKVRVIEGNDTGRLHFRSTISGRGLPFVSPRELREVLNRDTGRIDIRVTLLPGWGMGRFNANLVVEAPRSTEVIIVHEPPPKGEAEN